jgi:uncharacterized protein (DUF1330 family)
MAKKGYWVVCYAAQPDETVRTEYMKVAQPVIQAAGGRPLLAGNPAKAHEAGLKELTVVVEFESVEKAIAAYESAGYQAAAKIVQGKVKRDFRIVEGM